MTQVNSTLSVLPPAPHFKEAMGAVDEFYGLQPALRLVASEVLDVGCGEGRNTRYLALLGYRALGLDADENTLAIARGQTPRELLEDGRVAFRACDISRQGVDIGSGLGGVVCNEVLHLLAPNDRQHLVGRLMEATLSGGFHVISAYVGPPGNGTRIKPLPRGMLRSYYDRSGWSVIHHEQQAYQELYVGNERTVASTETVVAIKP